MNRIVAVLAVGLIGIGLGAGAVIGADEFTGGSASPPASVAATAGDAHPAVDTAISRGTDLVVAEDYSALYAAVRPSIVEIDTVGSAGRRFSQQVSGQGSGVVLDTSGHILTNYHVVSGSRNLSVIFADGSTANATVTSTDPADDLAVVQVNADAGELHPASLGDSGWIKVGNAVAAVGNPFGLSGSFSTGVVSGLDRTLAGGRGQADQQGLLQIDAAVNEGSSGGGVFDAAGELIGISTAIENPDSSTFAGVAYAVPINTAQSVMHSSGVR